MDIWIEYKLNRELKMAVPISVRLSKDLTLKGDYNSFLVKKPQLFFEEIQEWFVEMDIIGAELNDYIKNTRIITTATFLYMLEKEFEYEKKINPIV